ncbi:MAG: phosphoglycerate dehydrogenase [Proteobacteria bacterium]|nr:phosphoglycerate dehydrogenase [Pseudomonadota bacterium]MBU1715768.1 phosphoglycerate dehydrogenase [Pseudomonadota bacterium]
MDRFRIKAMNMIAHEGLELFDERFVVSSEESDPQGIVVRSAEVDIGCYPSLLAVARAGAGVNNISVKQATEKGICVFNTPGANANAVAELVFIMLGISARNIYSAIDFCRSLAGFSNEEISSEVEIHKANFRGFELSGKTLGILGLGKVGVLVANAGLVHKMKVIGFDPSPAVENIHALDPEVILSRSMMDVIRQSDILSLHMPYNDKTRGLVNAELLRQLPEGAILVNHARGPIVDEQAVLSVLDNGRLNRYITDFPSGALIDHRRVISSPHLGASTEESEEQCATMAVRELIAYLELGIVTHSVNFPTIESIPTDNVHTRLIMINKDVPGMIGFVSNSIGAHNINISSYLNESNGIIGYNIIDLESGISAELIAEIEAHPGVIRTRTILFA